MSREEPGGAVVSREVREAPRGAERRTEEPRGEQRSREENRGAERRTEEPRGDEFGREERWSEVTWPAEI